MTPDEEKVERCTICGFDGSTLQPPDAVVALRSLRRRWNELIDGVEPELLVTRPAPGVWSAAEYAAHSAIITGFWSHFMRRVLTEPSVAITLGDVGDREGPAPGEANTAISTADMIDDLGHHAEQMAAEAEHVNPSDWGRSGTINDEASTALYALRHAVHDATHHLRDVDRGLRSLGADRG